MEMQMTPTDHNTLLKKPIKKPSHHGLDTMIASMAQDTCVETCCSTRRTYLSLMRALLMVSGSVLATASRMPHDQPATWDSASDTNPAESAGAANPCTTQGYKCSQHVRTERDLVFKVCESLSMSKHAIASLQPARWDSA
jgi:hypothetical protein